MSYNILSTKNLNENDKNQLTQKLIDFFNTISDKRINVKINSKHDNENFGLNVSLALDNVKFRKNLRLIEYAFDEYDESANIHLFFDHKISSEIDYKIYQDGEVIHFYFLYKNDKDFLNLIIIFTQTMKNFQ